MALLFNPFPDTKLVLGSTKELWLLLGVLKALPLSTKLHIMVVVLTSYKQRRTLPCRDEVAVSVLTLAGAANAPRDVDGTTLWASRELAGRVRRSAERANTILNV